MKSASSQEMGMLGFAYCTNHKEVCPQKLITLKRTDTLRSLKALTKYSTGNFTEGNIGWAHGFRGLQFPPGPICILHLCLRWQKQEEYACIVVDQEA